MNEGTRPIRTSEAEIERLLGIAERDLDQARLPEIHLDTRYTLAYNAALQLATIVLRLDGTRIRKQAFQLERSQS